MKVKNGSLCQKVKKENQSSPLMYSNVYHKFPDLFKYYLLKMPRENDKIENNPCDDTQDLN